MKQTLTTEQVQFIENALIEKCDFKDFNDVRLEMVDHLASEIEEELNNNNFDFRTVFVKVFFKNNNLITSQNQFPYKKTPNVVSKIWSKLDVKYYYSVFLLAIILTFICYKLIEIDVLPIVLFIPFVIIGTISNIYLLIKSKKNKIQTSFSMYAFRKIKKFTYGFYLLVFINSLFFFANEETNLFVLYFNLIFYSLILLSKAIIANKSIKIENQLLKVI